MGGSSRKGNGQRLAGQLLTWETCPTSVGQQGLNTLPRAPTTPPMAVGRLPGTTALCARAGLGQCPLLGVGAAFSPRSQGVSLSLGQALAGRLTAHTGRLPTATTASWIASSGSAAAPSLPGPTSCQEQQLHSVLLYTLGQGGQAGAASVSRAIPPQTFVFCFLPLFSSPHTTVRGRWGPGTLTLVQSVLGMGGGQPRGFWAAGK